jgi:SNF2 family DNA or RNA helicase
LAGGCLFEEIPVTDNEVNIAPGDIVAGLEPTELVEIRRVAPFGGRTLVEGIGVSSKREIKRPLSSDDLAHLRKVRGSEFTYDGDAQAFLHGVEAERIRLAYQFDPLFAANSSVVDILPHQVEAVYRYLLPLPRIRFLLADDTGAGKTIMTGLLIKELLFRGVISKILIITPGGLTKQWQQDELQAKFGLSFRLVNHASFEADPGQFSRGEEGFFITSIDYLSRHDACLNAAKETRWDLIVVDEAHKLSAYEYGSKLDESKRYRALKELANKTDHLLFLTATPHRGRKDTFRRLLLLLDEDLFQKDEHVTQRVQEAVSAYTSAESFDDENKISRARNRFFLRRLKEEMVDWDGQPLFKPRHTQTVGYTLTPAELELYNAVTHYVRSRRKQAKEKKNRNVELTLMVMQRRLASSIYAITRTLKNRLDALDEVLKILRDPNRIAERRRLLREDTNEMPQDIAEYEELDESEREAVDKRIFRQVLSDKPEEVQKERDEIARLYEMAVRLSGHIEAKFNELLKVLDSSDVIRSERERLLIFTEHKDTLDNLAERLRRRGYSVVTIHGGMNVDERKQAQIEFKRHAKIMVATDAAGEGINLQFCRYMINWDIPWNPNRLEQRLGRIHRYGQPSDVWVYNLVAVNTREGAVLEKVLRKLDLMREQMGEDRVYDVIDDWLEDVPLVELIEQSLDAEDASTAAQQTEATLNRPAMTQRAAQLIELQKKRSLASRLDLKSARALRDQSDERRLQPRFVENFFVAAFRAAGGRIEADKYYPVFRITHVPPALFEAARRAGWVLADQYEHPFVFDKALVSVASPIKVPDDTALLGPRHPLFEAVIEWARQRATEAFARGTVLIDPNLATPQRYWLVRSSIADGRNETRKRLADQRLALVVADATPDSAGGTVGLRHTSPAYLLNCTVPDAPVTDVNVPTRSVDEIQAWTYETLTEAQLAQVRALRQSECDLRRQYLNTSFTDLIMELQEKLVEYQQLELIGEDNPQARQELEQRIQQLKERKAARLAELELMLRLTADLPEVITSAIAIPAPVAHIESERTPAKGKAMRRDEEIESIAMDVVMRYERARGWIPTDVSKEGEHYDIRSVAPVDARASKDYIRYIEVKGRAQSGDIVLTAPEVDKLRQLGERAFLYIVTFCKSEQPRLRIIQDPIPQLEAEDLFRAVQYVVDEESWQAKGEEVAIE